MLEMKDLHWLAGLVEGEGCYLVQGKGELKVQVAMTDKDVIERAAALFQKNRIYVREPEQLGRTKLGMRKRNYAVCVTGHKAAGWMMTLYPLMGERRQAKIRECLSRWVVSTRQHTHCSKGHSLTGDNLFSYTNKTGTMRGRGCRICRKAYNVAYASKWRKDNPELARANHGAWLEKNRDYVNAKVRERSAAKRFGIDGLPSQDSAERNKRNCAAWYVKHKDEILAKSRAKYAVAKGAN